MKNALLIAFVLTLLGCHKNPEASNSNPASLPIQICTTTADQSRLLQCSSLGFTEGKDDRYPVITIDTAQQLQPIEGFGFTLTGGSAMLLHQMGATERAALLQEFFGKNDNSIGVSYLRLSIGASDLDAEVFSYDDLPSGQTDPTLSHFNLSKDSLHLIPILKEILAINPNIKLMGSPWSPPVWMKSNGKSMGGNLKPAFYDVYAQYFVKYIQAYMSLGITISAVTIQNEPHHGGNNPSMVMSSAEQADFIKNHLGSAFKAADITTNIIIWDHNCDEPNFPIEVLDDPAAKAFVHGTAFHLYNGEASALSTVHNAHPDKALYFTEQWTGSKGTFDGDLQWHFKNVIIGTMRNWSQTALEWNLANDPNFGPHTPGGCTECRGALTIDGSTATKNVSYYIIGQASKFVPTGSVRLGSNESSQFPNVAFRTPAGKNVLIVLNEAADAQSFNINAGSRWITASLQGKSVGTFVW